MRRRPPKGKPERDPRDPESSSGSSSSEDEGADAGQGQAPLPAEEPSHALALAWAFVAEVVEASGWAPGPPKRKKPTRRPPARLAKALAQERPEGDNRGEVQRMPQSKARAILGAGFAVVVAAVAKAGYAPAAFFLCAVASPLAFLA
jgi:hypothetical protein